MYYVSLNGKNDTLEIPQKAQANFTYEPKIICEGMPVYFTDKSQGDIVSWHWDYGDGRSSLLQNSVRTYEFDGNNLPYPDEYYVVLTITDKYGCTDNVIDIISVNEDNFHQQIIGDSIACSGDMVVLGTTIEKQSGTSSTEPISYLWNTGDVSKNLLVTKSGEYIVEMKDKYNCSETAKTTVIFPEIPQAEISLDSVSKKDNYLLLSCKKAENQTYTWYQKTKNKWQQLQEKSNQLEMKNLKRKVNEFKVKVCTQEVGIPKCCISSEEIKIKL